MARIVKKFGGTSLGSLEYIQKAAERVYSSVLEGNEVVVVASAMAHKTDELLGLVQAIGSVENAESDAILASGEQISAALLALALQKCGLKSRSWMSWQLPITTTSVYGSAEIQHINTDPLEAFLLESGVSVVAGFQGVTPDNRLTTISRGGSDVTAAALAYYLKADVCEIYTDVSGVYTADPHLVPQARLLEEMTYGGVALLAQRGAQVLHPDTVSYISSHKIPLCVRSVKEGALKGGTWISSQRSASSNPIPVLACQRAWFAWLSKEPKRTLGSLDTLLPDLLKSGLWIEEKGQAYLLLPLADHRRYQALLEKIFGGAPCLSGLAHISLLTCVEGGEWPSGRSQNLCALLEKEQRVVCYQFQGGIFDIYVAEPDVMDCLQMLHDTLYENGTTVEIRA